jgi:hypothetical protein
MSGDINSPHDGHAPAKSQARPIGTRIDFSQIVLQL